MNTKTRVIEVEEATCLRCLHGWRPKVADPKRCTNCKSPYWNKPRKLQIDVRGRVNKYGFDTIEVGKWSTFSTAPVLPDGTIDTAANSRFWRSLEQFMRRHGYTYAWEGTGETFRVMRRT